jgi:transcriptional regulator with XRE-family HTH domain
MVDLHLIKHARLTKGYSQEKLAFDMGLSQSQYSRRENGIIEMNIDELNKIFIILELKADDYVSILFGSKFHYTTEEGKLEIIGLLCEMEILLNQHLILTSKFHEILTNWWDQLS